MKRIILRKLRLTGINKKDAIIEFKPGINIITGDSDTGKTFAYQCLNYIFGAKDEPKEIEESDGYQNISLDFKEFHIHDGNKKTCHLSIGDGDIDFSYYKQLAIKNDSYVVLEVKQKTDLVKSVPLFKAL